MILRRRCNLLDLVFVAKPIERLAYEPRFVIVDNPFDDTESVKDMVLQEVDHVCGLTSTKGIASAHLEK